MLKSGGQSIDRKLFIFALVGLTLTLVMGIILRMTYAGHFSSLSATFDIRRAHSHLGFYGFLFPFVWMYYGTKGLWVPRGMVLATYYVVCYLSILSFLILSYQWPSKALSFIVLVFWFFFAIKNFKRERFETLPWIQHVLVGIMFSCASVGLISVFGALGEVEVARKMVRVFMSFLVWGVFVPFSMGYARYPILSLKVWFASVILTSIFLLGIFSQGALLLGPLALAGCIFAVVYKSKFHRLRLDAYWGLVASGLVTVAFDWLPNSHHIAVAGFHFLLLGPVMQTLLRPPKPRILIAVYDIALLTMVVAILLMNLLPAHFSRWNILAAVSGLVLFVLLVQQSILAKQQNSKHK